MRAHTFACSVPDCPFRSSGPRVGWRTLAIVAGVLLLSLVATVAVVLLLPDRQAEADQRAIAHAAARAGANTAEKSPVAASAAPVKARQAAPVRQRIPSGADCSGVTSPATMLVCGDAELSMLDRNVQIQYSAALAVSPDPAALIRDHRRFLAARDREPVEPERLDALYHAMMARLDADAKVDRGQTRFPEP